MSVMFPQSEQKVTVELTLKEAMALTGYRFPHNPQQLVNACSKVKKALDKEMLTENDTIRYEELAH